MTYSSATSCELLRLSSPLASSIDLAKPRHNKTTQRATARRLFFAGLLFCFVVASRHACAQVQLPGQGIINTVAGQGGNYGYWGDGGLATSAGLNYPDGLAVDSAGNIYISDSSNFRIRKVTASTGIISTVAGNGTKGYNGDGIKATSAELNAPQGIAVDSAGNIYIADLYNYRIRKVTASTGIISTVAGSGIAGYSGDGEKATSAKLNAPVAVALDTSGNIYFTDAGVIGGNQRVRVVNTGSVQTTIATIVIPAGDIATVAGNGAVGYNGDGIKAISAELFYPFGLTLDAAGNIYIADSGNDLVRKVTASTGIISSVAGGGTGCAQESDSQGDGCPATSAQLTGPVSVEVDVFGNLYIGETYDSSGNDDDVREVMASTGIISTVAGDGTEGYSGDGGPATGAEIYYPYAVVVDAYGYIYIADTFNSAIRVVGAPQVLSILNPAYQVTSIIYAPPGNKSSAGYAGTTTNGTTTTVGSSFTHGGSVTFTEGFMPFGTGGSLSQSFGASTTSSNSKAFTETYTDTSGVTNQSNINNPNAINHNEDLFLIWLNPQITVVLDGTTPLSYSLGVQGFVLPDILEIFANVMQPNGSNKTTVPATWLNQQTDPATGGLTPGLASICANLNKAEYLANACTLADQCGCVPKDFAPILALDPLLSYPGTKSPLNADVSGATNCGSLPTPSGDCRYVPVPSKKGGTLQEIETLSGPESPGGNSNCNMFTQTDASTTTQTLGGQTLESVTTTFKEGSPVFSLTEAYTLTWTQMQSTGTTTGSGNSQAVNLCSATVGCGEDIAIYEDTEYHTFVFQQPTGNTSCP